MKQELSTVTSHQFSLMISTIWFYDKSYSVYNSSDWSPLPSFKMQTQWCSPNKVTHFPNLTTFAKEFNYFYIVRSYNFSLLADSAFSVRSWLIWQLFWQNLLLSYSNELYNTAQHHMNRKYNQNLSTITNYPPSYFYPSSILLFSSLSLSLWP